MQGRTAMNRMTPKRVKFTDNDPTKCGSCSSHFSMLCRKHACGKCEKFTCGKCSDIRVVLTKGSLLRERLCKDCSCSDSKTDSAPALFTPSKLALLDDSGGRRACDDLWQQDSDSDSDTCNSVKENLINRISDEFAAEGDPLASKDASRAVSTTPLSDASLKGNRFVKAKATMVKQDLVKSGVEVPASCSQCCTAIFGTMRTHICVRCNDSCCGDCTEVRVSTVNSSLLRQRLCKKCSAEPCAASSLFTPSKLDKVENLGLIWSADTESESDSDADVRSVSSAASAKTNLMASALQDEVAPQAAVRHPAAMAILCIVVMILASGLLLIGPSVANTYPAITVAQTDAQKIEAGAVLVSRAPSLPTPFSAASQMVSTVKPSNSEQPAIYRHSRSALSQSFGKISLTVGEVRRRILQAPAKILKFIFRLFTAFGNR